MSSMALRIIAIVTMLIDHMGAVLAQSNHWQYGPFMRTVGRIAFPIFVFLIAEGMRQSKNRPKYLLWLASFAIISIIPFSMFMAVTRHGVHVPFTPISWEHTNVFFTLFLGAASIYIFDLFRNNIKIWLGIPGWILGLAAPAAAYLAADHINSDYAGMGVAVIFATYFAMAIADIPPIKNLKFTDARIIRVIPLVIWAHVQYSQFGAPGLIPTAIGGTGVGPFALAAAIAPILILLYDGTPGTQRLRGRMKIIFYIFYPAHLLAIYAWSIWLR